VHFSWRRVWRNRHIESDSWKGANPRVFIARSLRCDLVAPAVPCRIGFRAARVRSAPVLEFGHHHSDLTGRQHLRYVTRAVGAPRLDVEHDRLLGLRPVALRLTPPLAIALIITARIAEMRSDEDLHGQHAFPPRDRGFSHRDDAGAEPRYLAALGRPHLNRSTDAAAGLFLQAPHGAPNSE
jgi:hypothetical protein